MKIDGKYYDVFDEGGSWMVRKHVKPPSGAVDDESDYVECLVGKDKAPTKEEAVKLAISNGSWG